MIIRIGKSKLKGLIDSEDYNKFSKVGNFFCTTGHGYVCIKNYLGRVNGKSKYKTQYLHRLITNAPKKLQVDHINGNKLDNRKSNLRLCSNGDNSRNKGKVNGEFKGVYFNKINKRWIAQITFNYKNIYLGSFENIKDAAKCYNEKAQELHGKFAVLNKYE